MDVLPFFRKSEDQERAAKANITGRADRSACRTRARDIRCAMPLLNQPSPAASNAPMTSTAPNHEGFGYLQLTSRKGMRSSTAVAFLRPTKNRKEFDSRDGCPCDPSPVRRPARDRCGV